MTTTAPRESGNEPSSRQDDADPHRAAARPLEPEASAPRPEPVVVQHTRLGGVWLALALGALVLILLLVFVLQNDQHVEIHIYGGHWNAPVGVALLMAAAFGVLLVVAPAGGRIMQLKRAARRLHRERESFARIALADSQRQSPPLARPEPREPRRSQDPDPDPDPETDQPESDTTSDSG
ncbi:LapA family protein [Actinospica durhamensis]|uniref:LapA family protein n=1 Tax=Actinospica durhamensis TaxID=1508375 RepID=A0A941ITC8_9ACTN|nr:LapA family protein [Actinospica durhamensis]MBR7834221.1 LapA family protein [Actinospica durhamensis]